MIPVTRPTCGFRDGLCVGAGNELGAFADTDATTMTGDSTELYNFYNLPRTAKGMVASVAAITQMPAAQTNSKVKACFPETACQSTLDIFSSNNEWFLNLFNCSDYYTKEAEEQPHRVITLEYKENNETVVQTVEYSNAQDFHAPEKTLGPGFLEPMLETGFDTNGTAYVSATWKALDGLIMAMSQMWDNVQDMNDSLDRLNNKLRNMEKKLKKLEDDPSNPDTCVGQEGFMYRKRNAAEGGYTYMYIPAEECSSSGGDTPNQQAPPSTT